MELPGWLKFSDQQRHKGWLDEASLVMARFGPGIGKENLNAIQASVRQISFHYLHRVRTDDLKVG